jgi:hypothetical protein
MMNLDRWRLEIMSIPSSDLIEESPFFYLKTESQVGSYNPTDGRLRIN